MNERRQRWVGALAVVLSACTSYSQEPNGDEADAQLHDVSDPNDAFTPDVDVEPDLRGATAGRYAFCDWRDLTRTSDLTADLVGEWIAFHYEIDAGHHTQITFTAAGEYRELHFAEVGCEAEPACFAAGPDDLCEATETRGTWSVEGDVLQLSGWSDDLSLLDRRRDDTITFGALETTLRLTAASCQDECLDPL